MMSSDWQITSRVPRQGDSLDLLVARMLTTHLRETVFASSSANATRSSGVLSARGFRGILIHLDITAYGGGGGHRGNGAGRQGRHPARTVPRERCSLDCPLSHIQRWNHTFGMKIKHLMTTNAGDVCGVVPVDGAPITFPPIAGIPVRDCSSGIPVTEAIPEKLMPEEILEVLTAAKPATPPTHPG